MMTPAPMSNGRRVTPSAGGYPSRERCTRYCGCDQLITPVRGRVYMADLGYGRKPWLAVSNNARNVRLPNCLAARVTTTPKRELATIIDLAPGDPLVGRVLCDDIVPLYQPG